MATHRSLNKLEFKAHMSIHNFLEVGDDGAPSSRYTRDRFGRKHSLVETTDEAKGRELRYFVSFILFFSILSFTTPGYAGESNHKGVNIQVSSSDRDLFHSEKDLVQPDEKPVFYQDETHSVGFNEDGDPSVNTRF